MCVGGGGGSRDWEECEKLEVGCEWMKDGRIEGWAFVVGKTF